MIKTLAAANKSEREHFKIPRSVQQSIPIQRIYRDGIWMVNGKYSRTWRFADINYSVASHEDQQEMFLSYCGVLNSLPTGATAKITINNRRLNGTDFQHSVLMRLKGDGLDKYRQEYNGILMEKAVESNNLIQDKYITISVERKNIEEARTFFKRVDIDLGKSFGKLDSGAKALDNHERLRIFHDFFRPGEEQDFRIDLSEAMKRGHSFKDAIAPDGMQFKADHFEIGGKVGRVLFLREYASYIKDRMITDLSDFSRNLMLSIDILPVPTNEAIKEMQARILGVESDITRWQQKQNANNNFTATVPYELEQLRAENKEFLDDLSTRDQRMIFANVTLVHMADTLEQLDADTETLQSIGNESLCQFSVLRYQQEDGLNTALPYGLRRVKTTRTLTTESTAVLMEQNKEHAFDAFCKRVVKNEAVNIQLEYSRQEQQEVVFSDLTPEERRQLQYIDTYAPERRVFRLFGMDMEISDGNLGRALDAVSKERRDIVLLAYLLGMTDVEIAKRLGLNRSTVQYRRTSTLEQLRKIMEENGYEYHKQ